MRVCFSTTVLCAWCRNTPCCVFVCVLVVCDTEWYFRSGLDRYIWIWGMVCAYIHPQATKLLNMIEELPQLRRCMVRAIILSAVGAAFTLYYKTIYVLPKAEYNKVRSTGPACLTACLPLRRPVEFVL